MAHAADIARIIHAGKRATEGTEATEKTGGGLRKSSVLLTVEVLARCADSWVGLDAQGVAAISPGSRSASGVPIAVASTDPGGVVAPRRCDPSGVGWSFLASQPVVALVTTG